MILRKILLCSALMISGIASAKNVENYVKPLPQGASKDWKIWFSTTYQEGSQKEKFPYVNIAKHSPLKSKSWQTYKNNSFKKADKSNRADHAKACMDVAYKMLPAIHSAHEAKEFEAIKKQFIVFKEKCDANILTAHYHNNYYHVTADELSSHMIEGLKLANNQRTHDLHAIGMIPYMEALINFLIRGYNERVYAINNPVDTKWAESAEIKGYEAEVLVATGLREARKNQPSQTSEKATKNLSLDEQIKATQSEVKRSKQKRKAATNKEDKFELSKKASLLRAKLRKLKAQKKAQAKVVAKKPVKKAPPSPKKTRAQMAWETICKRKGDNFIFDEKTGKCVAG